MEALTLDDTDPPPLAAYTDDPAAPPTVSERRMQALGDAIWAVYNMRETWRALSWRVASLLNKPDRLLTKNRITLLLPKLNAAPEK